VTVTVSEKVTRTVIVSPALYRPSVVGELTAETVGRVVSIVIVIGAEVAVLPAASVSVTVITQSPSARADVVHAFAETVHVTVVEPALVAVNTAVPAKGPAAVKVGVLSLVMLSLFEKPRSETTCRSGAAGAAIGVALMTTFESAAESAESTPLIVCFTLTEYVPLSIDAKVQVSEIAVAVKTQVTGVPVDGVAVTVTEAPTVSPAKVNVGVASAVALSVDDEPVSDAVVRSGAGVGVAGVTVIVPVEARDKLPLESTE
jgi:hypothetical protein